MLRFGKSNTYECVSNVILHQNMVRVSPTLATSSLYNLMTWVEFHAGDWGFFSKASFQLGALLVAVVRMPRESAASPTLEAV